jgi:hypothetical protein
MPLVSPWAVRLFERCVGPIPTNAAGEVAGSTPVSSTIFFNHSFVTAFYRTFLAEQRLFANDSN